MLTEQNAPAIALICDRVEGIPLALELAAARARVLTVEQLAERLQYDGGLLGPVQRAGLPQHRTMRATIDWSHDLLGEQERILLRRLAVFAGGWTLPMAEAVCSGAGIAPEDVLDLLAQLVDRSMTQVDARDAAARYRLAGADPTVRARTTGSVGRSDDVLRAPRRDVLDLAVTADVGLAGPDEIASLDRFEVEHDNLRAALALGARPGRLRRQRCAPRPRCFASGSGAATTRRAAPGCGGGSSAPSTRRRCTAVGRSTR